MTWNVNQTQFEKDTIAWVETYPDNSSYNIGYVCPLFSHIDLDLLLAAVHKAHQACSNLHAYFAGSEKCIDSTLPPPCIFLARDDWDWEDVRSFYSSEKLKPFDLSRGPLYIIYLIKTKQMTYVCMISSHAISDGYSYYLYGRLLSSLYDKNRELKSDVACLKNVAQQFSPVHTQIRPASSIFTKCHDVAVPYVASSHTFSVDSNTCDVWLRMADCGMDVANTIILTMAQLTVSTFFNAHTIGMKHSTLNRNSKHLLHFFGFLADAVPQLVTVDKDKLNDQLTANQLFISNMGAEQGCYAELIQQYAEHPFDICYCNYGRIYEFNTKNNMFSTTIQPSLPHMWCDDIKLLINIYHGHAGFRVHFRSLAQYVSKDDLIKLADTFMFCLNEYAGQLCHERVT